MESTNNKVLSPDSLDRKIAEFSFKNVGSIAHDAQINQINDLEERERTERMEKGRDPNIAYNFAIVNREIHQKIQVVGAPTYGEIAADLATTAAVGIKDAVVENAPIVAEHLKEASIATAHVIQEQAPIVAENIKQASISTAHIVAENAPIIAEKVSEKVMEGVVYTSNAVAENAPIVAEKVKESVIEASVATKNAISENAPIIAEKIQDAAVTTANMIVDDGPQAAEHMMEGGVAVIQSLGRVAYNASAVITGGVMDAVEPYASVVIDKLGDIEESLENSIKGYINTGKAALGMKVEPTQSLTKVTSWKVIDAAEEGERVRRMSGGDQDPSMIAAKQAVEHELLDTVSKPVN